MKKIFLFTPLLALFISAVAQDQTVQGLKDAGSKTITKDPNDTIPKTWKTGGLINLTFGQTTLSNWAAGGDNLQLNVNGFLNLHAFYAKGRNAWDNNLDLALGYVKTTSLGSRKSDDRIDLTSKYGYKLSPTSKFYLSLLFNFRSQFAPGFDYTATSSSLISEFMSPGYITLALGIDYKPNKDFSLFVSPITSRWVVVTATGLNPKTPFSKGNVYGVDSGKTVNDEIGAYLSATYLKELVPKKVIYKGKLDLFSNYKHNPGNVDVYLTNVLSVNLFKGLSFNFGLDIIYDDDVRIFGANLNGARTQLREYVGFGYSAKF